MAYQEYYRDNSSSHVYSDSTDSTQMYPALRKAKRSIPDSDKDERYWEKRKRNNMAAKKSRENKRLADVEIRSTVRILEEENIVLKKEVALLKSELGIPIDKSILTEEQRSECRQEAQIKTDSLKKEYEDEPASPGVDRDFQNDAFCRVHRKIENSSKHKEERNDEINTTTDYNDSMEIMNQMALYGPLNAMLWAAAPSLPGRLPAQQSMGKNKHMPSKHSLHYYMPYMVDRKYDMVGKTSHPDDQTCVKDSTSHVYDRNEDIRNGESKNAFNGFYNQFNVNENAQESRDNHLAQENNVLKRKLMELSTQVQEMKDTVLNS